MEPENFQSLNLEDDDLVFDIELKDDKVALNQLGTSVYLNKDAESTISPRELVTAQERSRFYFHVCCRKPQFGTYNGQPACLLRFDYAFQTKGTSSRFKEATIEVAFEDAATTYLDPDDDDNGITIAEGIKRQPRVEAFEPHQFASRLDEREGHTTTNLGLSASDPTNVVSAQAGTKVETPFIVDGQRRIHGVLHDSPPSRLVWTVKENALRGRGIFPEFSTPVVVSYTEGHKFAARISVAAKVDWRLMPVVSGKRDDPIFVDPHKLGARRREGQDLKSVDLQTLCNLHSSEGSFKPPEL